jgi:hypothetical protein
MQWPEPANTEQRTAHQRPTKGGAVRIRIALVAALGVAFIMVSILATAVRGSAQQSSPASAGLPGALVAWRSAQTPHAAAPGFAETVLDETAELLSPPESPPPAAVTTPAQPIDTVTPGQRASWERVAMCEEGGNWQASGPRFSGGLGISRSNWVDYGGGAFAPEAAMATADQQIMVAERIEPNPPDQGGCRGW